MAMVQWQNKSLSAAFHRWQEYVVTKIAHSAKVSTPASAPCAIHLLRHDYWLHPTTGRFFWLFGTALHLAVVFV